MPATLFLGSAAAMVVVTRSEASDDEVEAAVRAVRDDREKMVDNDPPVL